MLGIGRDGDTTVITNLTALGTATPGTAVTTGGTSATKGTAVELISAASNNQDSYGIYIIAAAHALAATGSDGALDILIGGATDTVLIPNLLMGYCSDQTGNGVKKWFFPLHIPGGVRIAAQAAGLRTTSAVNVGVKLYGGTTPSWRYGSKVTTYGMGTVPTGTSLTLGASGAQGAYTQVTATTSEDHICLIPSFQLSNQTTMAGRDWHIGIGLGAATEELYHEWDYDGSANETVAGPWDTTPVYRSIPSGTRLTVRGSNSGVTQTANVVIHAVS
jgi:hypothetical protein